MQVGVLGELVIRDAAGRDLNIGGALPRRLVAALVVAQGRPVAPDALVEAIWDGAPPRSATGTLHSTISRLRRTLDADRQQTSIRLDAGGYRLDLDADDVDAQRFTRLAREGRALLGSDPVAALALLERAEALWRGPALAEFADADFARSTAARWDNLRVDALEDALEARLALGAGGELIDRLSELTSAHPLRERPRGQLAIALYRVGRQAEALAEIAATRELLREELGIDPSPALREIEARLLRQDDSLAAARADVAPATPPPSRTPPEPAVRPAAVVPEHRLAGRDGEVALLRAALAEAVAGDVRFALLEGEPGIGKTRLLEEVEVLAEAAGARTVWGRCADGGLAPSYWPWLEALRSLDVEGSLGALPPELAGLLDPDAMVEQSPGDSRRFQLFEVVTAALVDAARQRPLVVLVEDLHWADPASAELLNHLAVRLHGVPVTVVATLRELEIGREDAVTAAIAAVARRGGTRRLLLRPVPASATGALIHDVVGETVEVAVAAAIHRRAQGNPFFIGELSRLLRDAGRLDDAAAADGADVPLGVRDVVRRRLTGLPADTRSVVEAAAVIGHDADLTVLVPTSDRPLEACIGALEPALASRVLLPLEEAPGRFRFAHALVRDAVLAEVSTLRRAQLHARVADALEAAFADDDDAAEVVASHLWRASAVIGKDRAARALERAADVAQRRMAYETADDLLARALSLWQATGGPAAQEAELLATVRLVSLRRGWRGYQQAYESMALDRAEELALRSGRTDLYVGLLSAQWGATGTSGDIPATLALGERIRALTADSDDPVLRINGGMVWAITCWHLGRMTEAAAQSEAVDAEVTGLSTDDLARLADTDSAALFLGFAAHIKVIAGRLEPEGEFERLADRFVRPYDRLVIANFGAVTAMMRGETEVALRWADFGLDHDREAQFPFFGGACEIYRGWALAVHGDVEAGLAALDRGMDRYRGAGVRTCLGLMGGGRVEGMLLAGRPVEEVAEFLAEVESVVAATGEQFVRPYTALARAHVAFARDDVDAGRAAVEEALALGEQMGIEAVRRRAADLTPTSAGRARSRRGSR